jgi:molecular chaperone DnaK
MVHDAEAHAEEDKKAHEMVEARNQCDAMIHSVKKALADYGDKIDADEKAKIEAAIKEAEEAIKGNDKAAMEAKTEALAHASQKLGEKVYAESQQQAGAAGAGAGPAGAGGEAKKDDADVVDAEFTEVKDKK